MVDIWLEALEDNEVSAVVMLDMSAAFDVVDHGILLDKLHLFGLDNSAINWFKSYLYGRLQFTCINSVCSRTQRIKY